MDSTVEHAVVGAAINSPETIPTVLTKITPGDLFDPKAETVLAAVADLWADTAPVDPTSVLQKLSGSQVSAVDLFGMIETACPPASVPHHLSTIAEQATVRRLAAAGQRITQLAQHGEPSKTITQTAQELLDNAVRPDTSEVRSVGESMADTVERMKAAARGEIQPGLPTGIKRLDELTKGLAGGQMIIVAARPGVGKSTLAVDFMRHASIELGVPSLMFSLEMGEAEVNQRILAAEASVPLSGIIDGNLSPDQWGQVDQTVAEIGDAPLYIDASDNIDMASIAAKSRLFTEKKGVGLIVVDYLQLLRSGDHRQPREQEIASYSRQMKLIAKACNVPVVVIAQLNRESVRSGRPPMVSDLRESGSLEQDADVVMLIDRPDLNDPNHERAGEADIIVGKNRRGRTGVAPVVAQLRYSRFSNLGSL